MADRSPNLYDVAAAAGVSHQTVSRVVQGFPGIRPETRDRVLAAIDEVGYRPNLAARALATRRSRALGVLTPATADFGPVRTLQAIESATRDAGYRPLVTSSPMNDVEVRGALGFLLDQSVEAIVIIAPYRVVLDELGRAAVDVPVVALQTGDAASDVIIDQAAGARLVVQHLVGQGHERIQVVTGPPDFIEAAVRRDAAHAEILGADLDLLPDITGDWTADAGYRAASRVDPSATAVVCGNDQMALGLIHGLSDQGRRVPRDISVTGFDDIPEASHCLPPLTTVRQDFVEVGRRAVARAIAALEGEAPPARAPIAPVLVRRASTASP